ncbi:MAG: gamma-glutamyl-gamma-aminobutyrate hydrolase family protein, partial [Patescibacteria group bacterium]
MLETFRTASPEALAAIQEECRVRRTTELFLLFSLGSQFDHLIKQSLEKLGVFCLVADPATVTADDVRRIKPLGIILSGGPVSVHEDPPPFDHAIFDLNIPVLGICLGFQLWAKHIGVPVVPSDNREFGTHTATVIKPDDKLFAGCDTAMPVLESHGDRIEPGGKLTVTAQTDDAPVSAATHKHLYGVQFHPEVTETAYGPRIFENFCFGICGAKDRFPAERVAHQKIAELRDQIGSQKVLLALSGGSDSSTVAYLLREAIQKQPGRVRGVYIKGIDRPDDEAHVQKYFGQADWLEVIVIDETREFLAALSGKTAMRDKRIAMRGVYKAILEAQAREFGANFIAQGTLYTDISESGGGYNTGARKAVIKVHHNTGLEFSLPELTPLDDCVKDNGRNIGRAVGVPEELLTRHPFPGPGLVIRIEGAITEPKLQVARRVDDIYITELRGWNLYDTVWQAGGVVTNSGITTTKGDDAGEGMVVALWAVWSVNG